MTAKTFLDSIRMQRDREDKSLKTFLAVSIPCSMAFHILILSNLGLASFYNSSVPKEEFIEVVAVESSEEKITEKIVEQAIEQVEEKRAEPEAVEAILEPVAAAPAPQRQNSQPNVQTNSSAKLSEESAPKIITGAQSTSFKIPTSNSSGNGSTINNDPLSKIRGLLRGTGTSPTGNGTSPTGNGTSPTGNGTSPTGNGTSPTGTGIAPTNTSPSNTNGSGRVRCQNCSKPDYPTQAKEQGLEGQAKVTVDVDADGNVTRVRILNSSGHAELDQAAIEAAKKWKFTPSEAGRSGIPAKVDFQLEGSDYAKQQEEQQRQRSQEQPAIPQPTPTSETAKPTPEPTAISTPINNLKPQPQQTAEPLPSSLGVSSTAPVVVPSPTSIEPTSAPVKSDPAISAPVTIPPEPVYTPPEVSTPVSTPSPTSTGTIPAK